jgi:hypothetical protein
MSPFGSLFWTQRHALLSAGPRNHFACPTRKYPDIDRRDFVATA